MKPTALEQLRESILSIVAPAILGRKSARFLKKHTGYSSLTLSPLQMIMQPGRMKSGKTALNKLRGKFANKYRKLRGFDDSTPAVD